MIEENTKTGYAIRIPSVIENFEFLRFIGRGFSSAVGLLKQRFTNRIYSVKFFSVQNMNEMDAEFAIINEMRILSFLSHPNIVQYKGTFSITNDNNDDIISLILEYCENGNCEELSSKVDQKKVMKDITKALYYLHSEGVAHRDLKPENFLLDTNFNAKLSDFGFATTDKCSTEHLGTHLYAAPEVLFKQGSYDTKKSDIWSLGVSFYKIATGELPAVFFSEMSSLEIEESLEKIQDRKLQNLI